MIFLSSTQNLNFSSRNNPVKPFTLKTKAGNLSCFEIPAKKLCNSPKLYEISHFFCKNFASLTEDPYWLSYNKPYNKESIARGFFNYLNSKILRDDGNLTMLVAEDENNIVQGACLSYTYDALPSTIKNLCYVDSIAINPEFRKNNVAKILLEKTGDINKRTFTDIFLTGEVLAKDFYKKLGFSELNKNDKSQRCFINFLEKTREGEMKYLIPYTKPLQDNKPRWFSKFA